MEAFAKAYLGMSQLRDRMQAELAEPKNKKVEIQLQLREKLRTQLEQVLKENHLTSAEYQALTRAVSVDAEKRREFEAQLALLGARR